MQPPLNTLLRWELHWLLLIVAALMAGVCLIGMWAAISRRHWFWRAVVTLTVPVLCLPIRAYGPAIYFFILMGAVATVTGILRRFGWFAAVSQATAIEHRSQRRFRFALLDLFLATTLVGMATLVVQKISKSPWSLGPVFILGTLPPIVVIAVSSALVWEAQSRRTRLISFSVLAAAVAGHIALQHWHFGYWVFEFTAGGGYLSELVISHLLVVLEFLTIMSVGHWLNWRTEHSRSPGLPASLRWADQLAWGLFVVLLVFPLASVYLQMLERTSMPDASLPATNAYPRMWNLLERYRTINSGEMTLADMRRTQPRAAKELESVYNELLSVLEQPAYAPPREVIDAMLIRSLARTWQKEAEHAAAMGNYDRMLTYDLGMLKWAGVHRRGATWLEDTLGNSVGMVAIGSIASQRSKLSPDQLKEVLRAVRRIEDEAEPWETILARSRHIDEEMLTWRATFARCMSSGQTEGEERLARNRRMGWAMNRLLTTEIQIELFRRERGRVPQTLDELVPDYAAGVPIDPITNEPFLYRVRDGSHALYSVGPDKRDDGGRFGGWNAMQTDGFDLDIETLVRKQ
jgi:hypothetical protein